MLLVFLCSIAVSGLVFLLLYFSLLSQWFENAIWDIVFLCIWAFFIIPAYIRCVRWVNEHLTFYQAFWLGYLLEILTYLLPILLAPVMGVVWWVEAFFGLHSHHEHKNKEKDNVFKDFT